MDQPRESHNDTPVAKCDVGLLVVHGIGSQKQGEHLVPMANAIIAHVESEDLVGEASPFVADVRSANLTGSMPAHVYVDVSRRGEVGNVATWLMAESLWAQSFAPPGLWDTLPWLARRAPLLISTRAVEGIEDAWENLWERPLGVVTLGVYVLLLATAPLLALALILVLAISSLVSFLIPIDVVRQIVASVQHICTQIVGDSFLYVTDPVRRAAMEGAVAHDLAWIRARAERVVVVAHSQGASVVTGIPESERGPIEFLFTLGAGIGQLAWLRRLSKGTIAATLAWGSALFIVATNVAFFAFPFFNGGNTLWLSLFLSFGGFYGYYALGALWKFHKNYVRRGLPESERRPSPAQGWEDLWASSDPVSGGAATKREFSGVTSESVWNHGDALRDHTGYVSNHTEVVSRIVRRLLECSTPRVASEVPTQLAMLIPIASALRQRRGAWLEWNRLIALVLFGVLTFRIRDEMHALGSYVMRALTVVGVAPPTRVPYLGLDMTTLVDGMVAAAIASAVYSAGLLVHGAWRRLESLSELRRAPLDPKRGVGSVAGFTLMAVFTVLVLLAVTAMGVTGSSASTRRAMLALYYGCVMAALLGVVWVTRPGRSWHATLRNATDEQLGKGFVLALPVVVIFGGAAVLNNHVTLMLVALLASYGVAAGYAIYAAARTPTSNTASRRRPWLCYPGRPQRYTPWWASFVAFHALVLVGQGLILWWYRSLRPRLRDAAALGDAQVTVAIIFVLLAIGVFLLMLEWAEDMDKAWWQKAAAVCGAIATHVAVPIGVFLYLW